MTDHRQTEMDFEGGCISAAELVAFLNDGAGHRIRVRLTRNRVTMVSVISHPDGYIHIRLHRAFLAAPAAVLTALRAYLRTRRKSAWQVVSAYCRQIDTDTVHAARLAPLRTCGRVHDLAEIMKEVNAAFFNGRVHCKVGWGRSSATRRPRRSRRSRSIRYGSWDGSTRTVRINPRLDDPRVPREFVRYIVFHEMLHAVVPREASNGRLKHHTKPFRILEASFPDFDGMKQLCREFLDVL